MTTIERFSPVDLNAVAALAALGELVRGGVAVRIDGLPGERGEPVDVSCQAVIGGRPRIVTGPTVGAALLALAGIAPKKACRRCGEAKTAAAYSLCRTAADGRNRYCKVCERARLKRHKARKKAARFSPVDPARAPSERPPVAAGPS